MSSLEGFTQPKISSIESYPPVIRQYLTLKSQQEKINRQRTVLIRESKKLEPQVIEELRRHSNLFQISDLSPEQKERYGFEGKLRLRENVPTYGKCTQRYLQETLASWFKGFIGEIYAQKPVLNDELCHISAKNAAAYVWSKLVVQKNPKIVLPTRRVAVGGDVVSHKRAMPPQAPTSSPLSVFASPYPQPAPPSAFKSTPSSSSSSSSSSAGNNLALMPYHK